MTEVARIVDELQRAHDGDPWHGPPMMEILAGASARDAAAHPLPGGHSIWEVVLHVTAWIDEVRARLTGKTPGEPVPGDWPPVEAQSDVAWTEAMAGLVRAHRDLLGELGNTPEERLWQIVGIPTRDRAAGTGCTFYVMLHGLVQHNVYHSAQIGMLRRRLEERKIEGGNR